MDVGHEDNGPKPDERGTDSASNKKLDSGSEEVQGGGRDETGGVRRLNKKVIIVAAVMAVAVLSILMTVTGGEDSNDEEIPDEEVAGPADVNEGQLDSFINQQGRRERTADAGYGLDSSLSAEDKKAYEEAEELQRALEARVATQGADAGAEPDAEDPWEKARKQAVQRYASAYFQDNFAARKSKVLVFEASKRGEDDPNEPKGDFDDREKVEYMRQVQRAAMASATTNGGLSNERGDKQDFFSNRDTEPSRSFHQLEEQVSAYEIQAGTILPLVLETGINSELPGMVKARFSSPVYDTATGEHLLIPSGAYVVGQYNDAQKFGESRVQVAWSRLILPNGKSMMLGNLPGVSLSGFSGYSDEVDEHWDKVIAGALLSSALAGSLAAAGGERDQREIEPGQAALAGAGESINQTGQEITKRNLEVEPTLRIRPGMQVAAFVRQDLILEPYRGE